MFLRSLSGDFEKINKLVGVASGACAQRNIRLSALCVDLFVVRSSCHVMATSFAWPSVLVKRGNTVIKSRTVVKCTWEQIFGGLLQHLGVCFNNFNEIHLFFCLVCFG